MKVLVLILLSYLYCYTESYKILVCFPIAAKSLSILGQGVVRHLINDGHKVTYITTYHYALNKTASKNLRQIDVSSNSKLFESDQGLNIANVLEKNYAANDPFFLQMFARENARLTLQHEKVIELLEDPYEHFDVVLADLFETELYAGLAVLYNCPMIWVYSMGAHWTAQRLIGDSPNPSYDTDYYGSYVPPFSFAERVKELWSRIVWTYHKTTVTLPIERDIFAQSFGPLLAKRGRTLPDYDEVIYNSSLIFGNEHDAIIDRPSTPQNFKYIGGFHVEDPVKPLPKDLQELMDNAPNGVIYFSMGSFWKAKDIPMKLTRALLNKFGELKQTVIWKYEEDLKDVPKNVHILKWAPQQSILAHPNCKIFISHGGLLSLIETIHFGVPIIGVPVLFDQYVNIIKAVANGHALKVEFTYDLPQNLRTAIDVMVKDDTYLKKAKTLSSIYHDRLAKPGEELAHWVRHVVRTGGALHLRSPALHVPLYQRLYLDLLALILGILFTLYSSIKTVIQKPNKNFAKHKKQ